MSNTTIEPILHSSNYAKYNILIICSNEDKRTAGRVVVVLDVIWKNRNNLIWNNEREDASKLGMNAFYN